MDTSIQNRYSFHSFILFSKTVLGLNAHIFSCDLQLILGSEQDRTVMSSDSSRKKTSKDLTGYSKDRLGEGDLETLEHYLESTTRHRMALS